MRIVKAGIGRNPSHSLSMRKRSFTKGPGPSGEGALLGYARVSKGDEQNNTLQTKALRAAGCRRLFEEAASGGRWDRPELLRLLDHLRVARHDGWPASDTRMAGRCASLRWPGVCEATRDFCRGSEGWNVRKVRHRPDRLPRRPIARTRGFVHNASALHTTPPAHQQQPRWIFIYSVR
jgi:hypothetical protein